MRDFLKGVWGKLLARSFPHKSLLLTRRFFPTLVAHSDVGIVTAEENLATGGNNVSVFIDARIYGGFATAGANGFDFGDRVSYFKEAAATGEEVCQKVGTQAEAHNGNVMDVNDFTQLIDLLGCEELTFIGDDNVRIALAFFKQSKNIGIGGS